MRIIAGSGPSLTAEVVRICRGKEMIAVNDACRLFPGYPVYSSDQAWWRKYALTLTAPKLTCTGDHLSEEDIAEQDALDIERVPIEHGPCSGYAAINLAVHFGAKRIGLVGFDMQRREGATHFYGNRTDGLRDNGEYQLFLSEFDGLANRLKAAGITVFNCTPNSALTAFKFLPLQRFINESTEPA